MLEAIYLMFIFHTNSDEFFLDYIRPLQSLITKHLNTKLVGHHLQSSQPTNLWAEKQTLPNPATMEWSPSLKQHYRVAHLEKSFKLKIG